MSTEGQQQQESPPLTCTSCGRQFRNKPELAGRTMKCPCGSAILVPRPHATADEEDPYDFAPVQEVKRTAAVSPVVGLSGPGVAPDPSLTPAVILDRLALPPERKGLQPEPRLAPEEIAPQSTLRDWIVPSVLIGIGILLRFVEAMAPWATKDPLPFGPALGAVAVQLVLSAAVLLAGMFLAVQVCEVCFVGTQERTAYKLIAIAVGPGALYAICSHAGGETYGAMIGTFLSIAVYAVLFFWLMRLDLKDTGICVLMTWVLVTTANYIAYRTQGLLHDSWV